MHSNPTNPGSPEKNAHNRQEIADDDMVIDAFQEVEDLREKMDRMTAAYEAEMYEQQQRHERELLKAQKVIFPDAVRAAAVQSLGRNMHHSVKAELLEIATGIPMPGKHSKSKKAVFRRGIDIVDAPVEWLWEDYLPRGMFIMLAGEGGTGKSTLTCALAAIVTTGGTWPDGTRCARPGNVLIWSSEDPAEFVIKPRLVAAGADAGRYGTIEAMDAAGKPKSFDPAEDMEMLYDECMAIGGVDLIIIDPILAVVKDEANAANKVRAALQPTVDLAQKLNCSIVGISHFAKGSEKRAPVDRVLNSQAFTALARMNLAAAKDECSDDCVLTRIKTNIAKSGDGFGYRLEQVSYTVPTGKTVKTQKIVWGEALTGSAREVLQSVAYDEKQADKLSPEAIEAARRFIWGKLWNGDKVLAVQMVGEARDAQISDYALGAAKKLLNVKQGPLEFGGRHFWYIQ